MAKRKQEINPKCGENLKRLYERYGITQAQLSEKTGISQNTLSRIINGKAALSYNIATQIADYYPDIKISWLMGETEFQTEMEEKLFPVVKRLISKKKMEKSVLALLKVWGISIELNSEDCPDLTTDEFCDLPPNGMTEICKASFEKINGPRAFVIKDEHGEIFKYISHEEYWRFIEDIFDYVDMKFDKLTQASNTNE